MPLIELDLPAPDSLRGGWAALAAATASRGGGSDVHASLDRWSYHDGGGNRASLRFDDMGRAVLIGHDHEYPDTCHGEAAEHFGEAETDLLHEAPDRWRVALDPAPHGERIGFAYGWDGTTCKRAAYDKEDGLRSAGPLRARSVDDTDHLLTFSEEAPGLDGAPSRTAPTASVEADAHVTPALLEAVVPGWDVPAGVEAARHFLLGNADR